MRFVLCLDDGFARVGGLGLTLSALALCLMLLGGCSGQVSDRDIRVIGVSEVAMLASEPQGGTLVIDARSPEEFARGSIPGSVNLELGDVSLTRPNPDLQGYRTIVVYGETPADGRSVGLTKRLIKLRHRVVMLDRGYVAWVEEGLPVERGSDVEGVGVGAD